MCPPLEDMVGTAQLCADQIYNCCNPYLGNDGMVAGSARKAGVVFGMGDFNQGLDPFPKAFTRI